jgi:hypothetical protein
MGLWGQYHPHAKLVKADHVCEFTEISDGDVYQLTGDLTKISP